LIDKTAIHEARERACELLQRVGLGHRLTHKPSGLYGGERQRVAIARALDTLPTLVLPHERTGNIGHQTAQGTQSLMLDFNSTLRTAFLVVTHDPQLAAQMDQVLRLEDGRLVAE